MPQEHELYSPLHGAAPRSGARPSWVVGAAVVAAGLALMTGGALLIRAGSARAPRGRRLSCRVPASGAGPAWLDLCLGIAFQRATAPALPARQGRVALTYGPAARKDFWPLVDPARVMEVRIDGRLVERRVRPDLPTSTELPAQGHYEARVSWLDAAGRPVVEWTAELRPPRALDESLLDYRPRP